MSFPYRVNENLDAGAFVRSGYQQEDFKLMGAYEIDYLLIVMTVTMLCEQYGLSL